MKIKLGIILTSEVEHCWKRFQELGNKKNQVSWVLFPKKRGVTHDYSDYFMEILCYSQEKMLNKQFKETIVEGASSAFLRKKREAHPPTHKLFYRNYWCGQVNHLHF